MANGKALDVSKLSDEELKAMALGDARPSRFRAPEPVTPEPVSPLVSVGRGMEDIRQGVTQKYLNWTNPQEAARYTADVNRELEIYEGGRKAWGESGFDPMRFAGMVGATAPGMALPGGAGLMGRVLSGGAQGGLLSYSTFSEKNDAMQNALVAGGGAVVGGAIAGVAPYVIDAAIKGGQMFKNAAIRGFSAARNLFTPEVQLTNEIRINLARQGVDFDKLSAAAQEVIKQDARANLSAGAALDPAQLARRADIESIAGPGSATKAQISRAPTDWSIERNLQRTEVNLPSVRTGAQETLTARMQAQDQAMKAYGQNVGERMYGDPMYGGARVTGERAATPSQASQAAIDSIRATDKARERAVGDLYKKFRESGMQDAQVPDTKIADTLGRVADDIGTENIPAAVLNRLREFGFAGGTRTKLLTINEADKLNRLINNNNPGFGPPSLALGKLKEAVTGALLDVPIEARAGADALLTARNAAAEMFAARKAGVGVTRAIEGVAPDKFLEQNVLGGAVRDLKALKESLAKSAEPSAWNDLRAQAWNWIQEKATQGGRAAFSGAKLDDTLRRIGEDRLRVLFTEPELQAINTLRRGSVAMTYAPPFSAVNYSNTAPTALAQLLRIGNRVGAGALTQPVSEEIATATTQKLLNEALAGRADAGATRALNDTATRQAFLRELQKMNVYGLLGASVPAGVYAQKQ